MADFWLDFGAMRRLFFCLLSAAAGPAQAQDLELGLRYWISTGVTQWGHNAQQINPINGNPTSTLTYEGATGHAIELHARKNFGEGWFARGNAGLGEIRKGTLTDEDFAVGQLKFSESSSSVKGNRLVYATLDIGRDLWVLNGGSGTIGLFAGYHHWSERLDAYGASWPVNFLFGFPDLGNSVPLISNEVTWNSLRVGVTWNTSINPKTRFSLDAAWLPHATLRNEDSHWLRSDFGPAPNVFIKGRGHGFQLDLELRRQLSDHWEAGAGLRHWWIESRKGDVSTVTFTAPLVELESQRTGLTLSLTRRW